MKIQARTLYGFLGAGVTLAFLGHGILGAKGKESFIELVTGSYDKVLGGTMSVSTAENWVNTIGWLDIGLAAAFLGLTVSALTGRDAIAYSPVAMYLFGWAMVWGFLTALSRYTAGLEGIAVWDVVERGPNYLAPAAMVYVVHRRLHAGAPAKAEPTAAVPGPPVPTH
jgi:hypothetical protein